MFFTLLNKIKEFLQKLKKVFRIQAVEPILYRESPGGSGRANGERTCPRQKYVNHLRAKNANAATASGGLRAPPNPPTRAPVSSPFLRWALMTQASASAWERKTPARISRPKPASDTKLHAGPTACLRGKRKGRRLGRAAFSFCAAKFFIPVNFWCKR